MPLSRHAVERCMYKFQVLAHRGLVSEFVPENTIKAFADALHAGADVIETDIQCTSDGVAIIFHDADLKRLAGISKKVSETSWKEISVIDIGYGKRIPTLRQALEEFPNSRFNLDIKSTSAIDSTADTVNELAAIDRVLISSFSESRRKLTVSKIAGPIRTSAGSSRVFWLWLASAMGATPLFRILAKGISALQLPVKRFGLRFDGKKFIDMALKAGLEIHYWTINDLNEVSRLKKLGATGIVSDHCDLVIAALKSKNI
jgi:glycerophosphoryl diester phosphodiesterase